MGKLTVLEHIIYRSTPMDEKTRELIAVGAAHAGNCEA